MLPFILKCIIKSVKSDYNHCVLCTKGTVLSERAFRRTVLMTDKLPHKGLSLMKFAKQQIGFVMLYYTSKFLSAVLISTRSVLQVPITTVIVYI